MAQLDTPADLASVSDNRSTSGRDAVRTTCGREIAVGHLRLERIGYRPARVTLSATSLPEDHEGLWASLTASEARRLAALLLSHATATEPEAGASTR